MSLVKMNGWRGLAAGTLCLLLGACAAPGGRQAPVEDGNAPPKQATHAPAPSAAEVPPAPPAAQPPVATPLPPVTPPPVPPKTPPPYPSEKEGRAAVLRYIPSYAHDRAGWAGDIFGAFAAMRIAPAPENYCAAIAVIEQESTFQADPPVPGLSRIVWQEIEKRRKKYGIPKLVVEVALLKTSPNGKSYKARINALKTEKQMNDLFEDMISELPDGKRLLESHNPIRTGGPMQVSVEFAEEQLRNRGYPYVRKGSVRSEVFSRRGGVYFGIADLLDYPAPYSQPVYRFADYNAGRYSSRNAAFQAAVAKLSGKKLDLDGDLLRYVNGAPSAEESSTQKALLTFAAKLRLNKAEMLRDLRQEKAAAFAQTPLYQRVFALADQKVGAPMPREMLPRIALKSPKIHRKLTTEWFAKRVDGRYRQCLERGLPK